MLIKCIQTAASPTVCYVAGQEYDVPDETAKQLIQAGQAVDPVGKVKADHKQPERQPAAGPQRRVLNRSPGIVIEKHDAPAVTNVTDAPAVTLPPAGTAGGYVGLDAATADGAVTVSDPAVGLKPSRPSDVGGTAAKVDPAAAAVKKPA